MTMLTTPTRGDIGKYLYTKVDEDIALDVVYSTGIVGGRDAEGNSQ